MSLVLLVRNGDDTHAIQLSARPFTIGRSSKCDLKVDDDKVSGKHCAVLIEAGGKALIKDLDSSNGTFLNNSNVRDAHIFIDDEITIGNVLMWLDESQMSPKEVKTHTREGEKTQVNFIKLKGAGTSTDTAVKKAYKKKASEEQMAKKAAEEEEFDMEIEEDMTATRSVESRMKDRMRAKGKSVDKQHGKVKDSMIKGEAFEQEESSGQTQFIKIDKSLTKKKKETAKKKRKKENAKKKESLGDKLMGMFKKK